MAGVLQPRRCRLRALLAAVLAAAVLFFSPAVGAREEGRNRSSLLGQPRQWATGKDEAEILAEAEARGGGGGESAAEDQGREFASLDSMLQWAIGNSDPDKLREKAEELDRLSADELLKRQMEIKELMEKLKMPSDADLMKILISDLNNSSVSLEDRQRALQELLVFVEPIDNANDLDKLGGLLPLIEELNNTDEGIRTTSAWVLGKASQNNAHVQNQILGYGALERLVKMGYSSSAAEAAKALYAISSLIRDNEHGQELFLSENGYAMLQHILSTPSTNIRLQKKVVSLLAYVADFQLSTGKSHAPFLSNHLFIKSVVDMISASDLDLQEKSLLAVRSLLQLTSADASDLQKFLGLDDSLDALKVQLDELTSHEERREYDLEIEILRREVQLVFQQKFYQRLPRLCAPVRRLLSLPRHFYSHASPDPVSSTAAARATAPEGVSLDGLTTVAVIPTACQAAVAPSGRGASGSQGPWHTYSRPREPGAWGSFNQRCHGLGSRELEPARSWSGPCGFARCMRWTPEPRHQKSAASCNNSCISC